MTDDLPRAAHRHPPAAAGGLCPVGCAQGPSDLGALIARRSRDAGAAAPERPALRDMGAQPSPLPPSDEHPEITQAPPEILLRTTPDWRAACLRQVAHIPSGYTYLAQLMGHDMGRSTPADEVPYSGARVARYNLIDNPLTLETIYGPGPGLLAHVYDPETLLFRLTPGARLARLYARGRDALSDPDPRPIRALYDERNRDSLMMHELTVAWMQFHNRNARALMRQGMAAQPAYCQTRAHAVRCWHAILQADLLPRFLHPQIAALPADLPAVWALDETTLLHGLSRAFHALPLAGYALGRSGQHNLNRLLKRGYDVSEAETDWQIDWALFFGSRAGGPITGLSASVALELRAPITAEAVIALDNASAAIADPMRAGDAGIARAIAALPDPWPARLSPQALAADFTAAYPAAPIRIAAEVLEWGPLYQFLMVEAQLHGQSGGFGPLGSALLRGSVLASLGRVVLADESPASRTLPHPATMLDLITLVRTEERP